MPETTDGAAPRPFGPDDVAVLVLGVHRSGTSLLTAGLAAAGCDLGTFADRKTPENPRGYFEHAEVRRFNDALLERLGASWDDWGFDATACGLDGPAHAGERAEAAALLARAFAGRSPFALKDPRVAFLNPFWEATFSEAGLSPRRIVLLRHPDAVAASQVARARRNPAFHRHLPAAGPVHALWLVTMHTLLSTLGGEALILSHDDLHARPAETVARAAAFAGLSPDMAAVEAFARDFVDPALNRADREDGRDDGPFGSLAGALHDALAAPGLPRRLCPAEARDLAEGSGFATVRPVLRAVHRSLSGAAAAARTDARRIERLRTSVELYADIATRDGAARSLAEARQRLAATARGAEGDGAVLLYHLARLVERLGDHERAAALLREALAARPDTPRIHVALVGALETLGRSEEAGAAFREGAARFPDHPFFKAR